MGERIARFEVGGFAASLDVALHESEPPTIVIVMEFLNHGECDAGSFRVRPEEAPQLMLAVAQAYMHASNGGRAYRMGH